MLEACDTQQGMQQAAMGRVVAHSMIGHVRSWFVRTSRAHRRGFKKLPSGTSGLTGRAGGSAHTLPTSLHAVYIGSSYSTL